MLFLQTTNSKNYFLSCAKQTTNLASINSSQLKALPVIYPDHNTQIKIIKTISFWDSAIEKTERLIEGKQKIKLALMQKLFQGCTDRTSLPRDMYKYHLGELFSERTEINRLDLSLLSITGEEGVINRENSGRKDTSSEDKTKYLRICPGDIGYNTMRMWQGVSALSSLEGIVSPAYTIVMPKPEIDAEYASFLFKHPPMINEFYRYSQGLTSDTWNLKFDNFSEIIVNIPEIKDQKKIARLFREVDHETRLLKRTRNSLDLEKSFLMSKLLTGEWEAPDLPAKAK